MKKDTGGPAFPVQHSTWDFKGMTLRDWFAGQALVGLLSYYGNEGSENDASIYAGKYADAMISERNKP